MPTRPPAPAPAPSGGPAVPEVELAPGWRCSRLIRGGWQRSGDDAAELAQCLALAEAGVTRFEAADTVPDGEARLGAFLAAAARRLPAELAARLHVHARCTVPLSGSDAAGLERRLAASLGRLGLPCFDLLQLQCWNLDGLVAAGRALAAMQAAGRVRRLGVCNLGVAPLSRLLDAGIPVASNQVPFSLLDRRVERGLGAFCRRNGIRLLTYGPLAGGFLGGGWRSLPPPPQSGRGFSEEYWHMLSAGPGWPAVQRLLAVLADIADRHGRSPAQVALCWVLQRGPGAAVLFGASHPRQLREAVQVFTFRLSEAECRRLETVSGASPPGDIGELERAAGSPMAAVIRRRLAPAFR